MYEKLVLLSLVVFVCILIIFLNNRSLPSHPLTLLALGDSYTIGEGVAIYENFPYQTVQLLRKSGYSFHAPELLARTGWTTGDLKKGLKDTLLQGSYDVVSLLIGVNNQYNNLPVKEYAVEFEQLIKQAIMLAAGKPDHVFVFSIPDWSETPFAKAMQRKQPDQKVDAFNRVNEEVTRLYKARYLTVTAGGGEPDASLLADDGLHPSGKAYGKWAGMFSEEILRMMNQ